MHMQTQVDDDKREVICLYKLIEGRAESSYGTRMFLVEGAILAVYTADGDLHHRRGSPGWRSSRSNMCLGIRAHSF